ncbi:hypothetical protein BDV40DRAFT_260163 [Aspergillus tamarii]|uniref:Uncharacterized protein n=1 Tax=Aspergillus tamarii TaxID=41984 RepID=A0A5N6V1C4_ASPTM|nr:hypothetical protein BDV40DRAFT_260163 [Aspergillus tamarii]
MSRITWVRVELGFHVELNVFAGETEVTRLQVNGFCWLPEQWHSQGCQRQNDYGFSRRMLCVSLSNLMVVSLMICMLLQGQP